MATFVELRDQLSADSYERGKQFERVCKWFLETDPRYSNRLANQLGVLACEGVWRARRDSNPQPSDP